MLYRVLFKLFKEINHVEINLGTQIGGGLYIGHPFCITINPDAKIGSNVNLHRGVVIGQENRGKRKGAPIIGDEVWIGINATVVGKIVIGDDVLIAPNSYVNCNVPSHSIVIGNPC
jgi:serine O-acetyltransferase